MVTSTQKLLLKQHIFCDLYMVSTVYKKCMRNLKAACFATENLNRDICDKKKCLTKLSTFYYDY